ncbi:rhombotarget lipoprotein [Aliikangiella maris]|uniref:Rhombotarget lipoprotein n=2 Tax=Aliikangiella maris TaxID=3162458 RepID=A0ABV3MNK1_9GAMM
MINKTNSRNCNQSIITNPFRAFRFRYCLPILGILLLSGCLSHTRHATSSNLIAYLYPDGNYQNHQNDTIPHLNLPLKVGIAFIPESNKSIEYSLTEAEKLTLLSQITARFNDQPYIQSIEIIPELYLRQGKGFRSINQIANLHNIDVMALVSYDHLTVSEENRLSLAYLTVVGALFIPGETSHTQTFVDTAVFDVATQKLLFRAPGAASITKDYTMIAQVKKARQDRQASFQQAVEQMIVNLEQSLEKFEERVKNREQVEVSYSKGYQGSGSFGWLGVLFLIALICFSRHGKTR